MRGLPRISRPRYLRLMLTLATATWTEVETYLKTKRALVFPIGSTEQHGPTGMIGTDFLCAEAVAKEVAAKLGLALAPTLPFGMASHHMAFPGSVTLKPSVYQAALCEILRSFCQSGFREIYLVNGHGGNEFSVRAAFQELKHEGHEGASFYLYNWWRMPTVVKKADELYGEWEGFHATPSEVSLTYYLNGIEKRAYTPLGATNKKGAWPLTGEEVRKQFPDGVMASDPGLSRAEHGKLFLDISVGDIITQIGR